MPLWVISRPYLLGLLLLVGTSGCASVDKLADTLNKRHVRSCVRAMGAYAMFLAVEVIAATGGATIAECRYTQGFPPPLPSPALPVDDAPDASDVRMP